MKHHTYRCVQSAIQSAIENLGEDASPEEHHAEALNYLETGISDCHCDY